MSGKKKQAEIEAAMKPSGPIVVEQFEIAAVEKYADSKRLLIGVLRIKARHANNATREATSTLADGTTVLDNSKYMPALLSQVLLVDGSRKGSHFYEDMDMKQYNKLLEELQDRGFMD